MPTALSYPGLRCVLEFLDPMKRIHIASRNHSLQTIDKTIPIWIKDLGINLNCLSMKYYAIDNYIDNKFRFKNRHGKYFERIWPSNLKPEEARKKLFNSYLRVKSKIYVNCFFFFTAIPDFVPTNLLFQINELICSSHYIDGFLPVIDPSSFPLKKFRTGIDELDHLNYPVLTSAQELTVLHGLGGLTQLINEINTNKLVIFEKYSFRAADPVSLIKSWKENGKEIGTTFKFHDYKAFLRVMHILLQELKEFENEKFNNHSSNCPRLMIPINKTAEIHVSQNNENYIVVEVVPITLKRETDATEEACSSKRVRHS
ncbi:hypothetical protein CRE_17964 [Caenorhabditis remanei]|uniref:F-box domain-containing protein n=1 Tax=Caenorhabditis remanei TaxID=31234 RepID=E3MDS9_CAERE|nr:hypothetical protein CRE_17964 [Caenorhabditis remanei]